VVQSLNFLMNGALCSAWERGGGDKTAITSFLNSSGYPGITNEYTWDRHASPATYVHKLTDEYIWLCLSVSVSRNIVHREIYTIFLYCT
jgi:hypothetical protein